MTARVARIPRAGRAAGDRQAGRQLSPHSPRRRQPSATHCLHTDSLIGRNSGAGHRVPRCQRHRGTPSGPASRQFWGNRQVWVKGRSHCRARIRHQNFCLPAYYEETKLRISLSTEDNAECSPIPFLRPAMLASFQLADVGGIHCTVSSVAAGKLRIDEVSQFLSRKPSS